MIAITGAAIVLARLPSDRNGASFALASSDLTNTTRIGELLALVGPNLASS